jgi:hypothetical protein
MPKILRTTMRGAYIQGKASGVDRVKSGFIDPLEKVNDPKPLC